MSDYGVEDAFDVALEAAETGWDAIDLSEVPGNGDLGAYEELRVWYPPNWRPEYYDIATARLNVLERQERVHEFLELAKASGKMARYATMLARIGRIDEAVEVGLRRLRKTSEALDLAKMVRERGAAEAALRIAEHGMMLQGTRGEIAAWARDLAVDLGQIDRAVEAATIAVRERPNLGDYARLRELSGADWPARRDALLAELRARRSYDIGGEADIFLHEGRVADAIAKVDGTGHYALLSQVADAALASHPEWVISTARRQAEAIMNAGDAGHYDVAARWLAKARSAYDAAARAEEWFPYLEDLIEKHRRKYKLRPMLEALRR